MLPVLCETFFVVFFLSGSLRPFVSVDRTRLASSLFFSDVDPQDDSGWVSRRNGGGSEVNFPSASRQSRWSSVPLSEFRNCLRLLVREERDRKKRDRLAVSTTVLWWVRKFCDTREVNSHMFFLTERWSKPPEDGNGQGKFNRVARRRSCLVCITRVDIISVQETNCAPLETIGEETPRNERARRIIFSQTAYN